MMTELILVEGVSDVQLISYYLQNVYSWKHEKENILKMVPKQALRFIRNRGLVFQPFSFISADFDQIVIRVTHIKALHFP